MKRRMQTLSAMLATSAMVLAAGQAAAKETVKPVWNCSGCHQQEASELWGTLVPGSQADGSFKLQTGEKEVWTVRYDKNSRLAKMATVRDLADEKAVRIKFKAEGGKKAYVEEMSYKPNYGFKNLDHIITINEVAELLKKSPQEGNYVIIDSRGYDNYIEGHLPNAVLLPNYQFQEYKDRMPADKNTMIVAYCRGYGWGMSPHFARLAKEVYGYKNVKYMVEGHMAWQGGINPYYTEPEFLKLAQEEGLSHILVDVRSPEKARDGHIQGAVNYPLAKMKDLNKALPGNQKKLARIIYYSDNEAEAVQAHKIMRSNGWENGYILNGGLAAWQAKGYPLVKDQLQSAVAFQWTPLPGAMFIQEYEKVVAERPADTIIVDVRSPAEFMKAMVPGALTIPIDTLEKRMAELPRDRRIVLQCEAGNRALQGWRILKDNGFKQVRWVDGHISQFSAGVLQEGAYKGVADVCCK